MGCIVVHLDPPSKAQDEPAATTKALQAITQKVAKARKVIIAVGAGISTSAGIADFRSKDTGLYATRSTRGPAMFSSDVYASEATRTQHWQFMSEMQAATQVVLASSAASKRSATPCHEFMRTLKRRGMLQRVYTQNIDGFEQTAGLEMVGIEGIGLAEVLGDGKVKLAPSFKGKGKAVEVSGDVVQLHGSLHRVRCSACAWVGEWTMENTSAFTQGMSVDCPACQEQSEHRARLSKRRIATRSYVRPSIVLYNENSPAASTIGSISIADLSSSPDLLIVAGTTLRIPGFKRLVREFSKVVKSRGGICVFVNREEASQVWQGVFDYQVVGNCDDLCERVTADWRRSRPSDWTKQMSLATAFTQSKPTIASTHKLPPSPPRAALRELAINAFTSPLRTHKRTASFEVTIDSSTQNKRPREAVVEFSPSGQSRAGPSTPVTPNHRPRPLCFPPSSPTTRSQVRR